MYDFKNEIKKDTVKLVLSVILIALVISSIFYWNYQKNKTEQLQQQETDQRAEEAQKLDQAYSETIRPLCDKKINDLTAVDLYRCQHLGESKESLSNPDIPSFCQRKILEMTANELKDCFDEQIVHI